ncbi:hypothetical protein RRG08_036106 [Elysia crispata]|uniref:PH domain-containing protein n=1 Tax=Elysia crispata TaxID=231223 RepID=A0AAE1ALF6_9GAST|nr:hypothetical protein RRG08_036106 [Elysia crispata]
MTQWLAALQCLVTKIDSLSITRASDVDENGSTNIRGFHGLYTGNTEGASPRLTEKDISNSGIGLCLSECVCVISVLKSGERRDPGPANTRFVHTAPGGNVPPPPVSVTVP